MLWQFDAAKEVRAMIWEAYDEYLAETGLEDSNLHRLEYFTVVLKEMEEGPLSDPLVQTLVRSHITIMLASLRISVDLNLPLTERL